MKWSWGEKQQKVFEEEVYNGASLGHTRLR